ncbi:MAG TPA: sugar ABC transporter substrate-binding protein [Firmicutes bacterium]|nr:sugar ABC transporter substrate-binding protein [Bacillota bacterium]
MKLARVVLMACVVLSLLVAVVFGTAGATKPVTISMVYWPGPEAEAMEKVVKYYNEKISPKSGVKVEMVLFGREGFFEKEATMMAARSSDVDLYFTCSYIVGQHAPYLETLNDYFAKTKIEGGGLENILPVCVDAMTVDGQVKGLTLDASINLLLYRKDLINRLLTDKEWQAKYQEISKRELGKALTPKQPTEWNWDDFMATALFLSKAHNPDSPTEYGTALQAKNMWPNGKVWSAVLRSMGGSWFDDKGKPAFNSPKAIAALKLYADLVKKDASPKACINYEYTEPNEAFKSGRVALLLQWGVAYNELSNKEVSPLVWDKVGIAPHPGERHVVWLTSMGVGVNKFSKNKEAALKWLGFLTTTEAMKIYGESGGVPPVAEVLTGLSAKNPYFGYAKDYLAKYAFSEKAKDKTVDVLRVLAKYVSAVSGGQIDPETAAGRIQKEVEDLLK